MTVASTLNKKQYQGNSLTVEFPLPFHVTAKEHIFALRKKGTAIEEIKNNFAVDLERKVFIYPLEGEPLKNDESLTVYRKIPLTQIVDLENAGAFHPEVLEYDGFDRIVMQIQQLDEEISRALKIDMTDTRDVSNLLEELFAAREEAILHAQKALEQAKTAVEKAEKTEHWALYAEEKVQELTDLQVECFISNDGQGHVSYMKEEHKLQIVLPFDNAGLNHPKTVLSDSIDLARSDIGASAKAVQSLHAKTEQDTAKLQASKLDKSALSSALDSESEETAASSKAVKEINDKMGKVRLLATRTSGGAVTLTDVVIGKPIFIIACFKAAASGSMCYARYSVIFGSEHNDMHENGVDHIFGGPTNYVSPSTNGTGYVYGNQCAVVIPAETTVEVAIENFVGSLEIKFFQ